MVKASFVTCMSLAVSLALASYGYGQCRGGCCAGGCGMGGPMMGMPMMMPGGLGMPAMAGGSLGPCGLAGCICGCPTGACLCSPAQTSPAVAQDPNGAKLIAKLPRGAAVWIDGEPTTSTGPERTYLTPALEKGRDWHYVVQVVQVEKGKVATTSRTVTVRSGETTEVDFTAPLTPERSSASTR